MHTSTQPADHAAEFDVIVIGGSYAGLSAALQLARARRRVLVIDAGQRRNRNALHSHGFLTQDGSKAADIAAIGREQLLAYPTVAWVNEKAMQAAAHGDNFIVTFADGGTVGSRRLVLASGVSDTLPAIDGLAERWGSSVFHCPYCHGYELNEGDIGVIAASELSMHQAMLLPDWGRVTFFLNGAFDPDTAQLAALHARGVRIEAAPIARIEGQADVVLNDGRTVAMAGLFVMSRTDGAGALAQQLGCVVEEGPLGPFVQTDMMKATSVPGVFCCGDMARAAGNVAFAVADGAMAGVAAHRSLIAEFNHQA